MDLKKCLVNVTVKWRPITMSLQQIHRPGCRGCCRHNATRWRGNQRWRSQLDSDCSPFRRSCRSPWPAWLSSCTPLLLLSLWARRRITMTRYMHNSNTQKYNKDISSIWSTVEVVVVYIRDQAGVILCKDAYRKASDIGDRTQYLGDKTQNLLTTN